MKSYTKLAVGILVAAMVASPLSAKELIFGTGSGAKSKINIPMSKMKNVINNNIGKKIIFAYRKNIQKKTSL